MNVKLRELTFQSDCQVNELAGSEFPSNGDALDGMVHLEVAEVIIAVFAFDSLDRPIAAVISTGFDYFDHILHYSLLLASTATANADSAR